MGKKDKHVVKTAVADKVVKASPAPPVVVAAEKVSVFTTTYSILLISICRRIKKTRRQHLLPHL